jgi:hypothetical protein
MKTRFITFIILALFPVMLFGQTNLKLVRSSDSTFAITNQNTPEDTIWKFTPNYLFRYESNAIVDTVGFGAAVGDSSWQTASADTGFFSYIINRDKLAVGGDAINRNFEPWFIENDSTGFIVSDNQLIYSNELTGSNITTFTVAPSFYRLGQRSADINTYLDLGETPGSTTELARASLNNNNTTSLKQIVEDGGDPRTTITVGNTGTGTRDYELTYDTLKARDQVGSFKGVKFPDNTIQTTASANSGSAIGSAGNFQLSNGAGLLSNSSTLYPGSDMYWNNNDFYVQASDFSYLQWRAGSFLQAYSNTSNAYFDVGLGYDDTFTYDMYDVSGNNFNFGMRIPTFNFISTHATFGDYSFTIGNRDLAAGGRFEIESNDAVNGNHINLLIPTENDRRFEFSMWDDVVNDTDKIVLDTNSFHVVLDDTTMFSVTDSATRVKALQYGDGPIIEGHSYIKDAVEAESYDHLTTDTIFNSINDTVLVADMRKAIRKILYPNDYASYLPLDSIYTTPLLSAATPTKVLIPTAVKYSQNWALFDKGGGDFALRFVGEDSSRFHIDMSTSMQTSASNVIVKLFMYKNGVLEPGIAINRKVGTGTDTGALAITGSFDAAQNDYIEIFAEVDAASSITFIVTSIRIKEDGEIR